MSEVTMLLLSPPALWSRKSYNRGCKLPNYGDTLKLIVPSHNGNTMSGWTNYSEKVTSYKINESKMGYRVSKSQNIISCVKEQRVDGNCSILLNKIGLRYTLMGFERNYQIRIRSKLNNILRTYTSNNNLESTSINSICIPISPWFVTGFTDAEGCFEVSVREKPKTRLGWTVQFAFQI